VRQRKRQLAATTDGAASSLPPSAAWTGSSRRASAASTRAANAVKNDALLLLLPASPVPREAVARAEATAPEASQAGPAAELATTTSKRRGNGDDTRVVGKVPWICPWSCRRASAAKATTEARARGGSALRAGLPSPPATANATN
jgi:hypothetical protein